MGELKNIKIVYGADTILENINLRINEGEKIAIIGKNGCGKTSLLNAILKLKSPKVGEIKYSLNDGQFYRNFGVQLQDASFDERLTIRDYCDLMESIYNIKGKADFYLELFELKQLIRKKIANLSGGERQKLNIVFSLFHDPHILIFDEITTGLDSLSRSKIRNYIKKFSEERTLIIVSHYMEEIEELCDRVVLINNRKIEIDKKISAVIEEYGSVSEMYEVVLGGIFNE